MPEQTADRRTGQHRVPAAAPQAAPVLRPVLRKAILRSLQPPATATFRRFCLCRPPLAPSRTVQKQAVQNRPCGTSCAERAGQAVWDMSGGTCRAGQAGHAVQAVPPLAKRIKNERGGTAVPPRLPYRVGERDYSTIHVSPLLSRSSMHLMLLDAFTSST